MSEEAFEVRKPDSEFTYKRWSGEMKTVVAYSATFEPSGHVAFRDADGRIVLAEETRQVSRLTQTYLEPGDVR